MRLTLNRVISDPLLLGTFVFVFTMIGALGYGQARKLELVSPPIPTDRDFAEFSTTRCTWREIADYQRTHRSVYECDKEKAAEYR